VTPQPSSGAWNNRSVNANKPGAKGHRLLCDFERLQRADFARRAVVAVFLGRPPSRPFAREARALVVLSFQRASGYGQVGSGYVLPMAPFRVWVWDVPIYIVIGFLFFVLAPWHWGFEYEED
jgi:hypothetical protein